MPPIRAIRVIGEQNRGDLRRSEALDGTGQTDPLRQTAARWRSPPQPKRPQMNQLSARSRIDPGPRKAAARHRLSGRSRSSRVDQSTIMSPALYPGSSTQIRQGVRGARTSRQRLIHNHSPPRALTARMTRRHDVQIKGLLGATRVADVIARAAAGSACSSATTSCGTRNAPHRGGLPRAEENDDAEDHRYPGQIAR